MTEEQQARLEGVIAALETLPTPEVIIESQKLRCSLPLTDKTRRRLRMAYAGGISAQRLLSYIEALDDVDEHRQEISRNITQLLRDRDVLLAAEDSDAAYPMTLSAHLAGRMEVDNHFFAVCVGRIERFLPKAARAAGHKISKEDLELLGTFRPVRDHYEHFDERLPGGDKYSVAASESEENGRWTIRMGLTVDPMQRIVIDSVAADMTPRGLATVREIVRRNWDELKPAAIEHARKYFVENPDQLPHPDDLDHDVLVSTGNQGA